MKPTLKPVRRKMWLAIMPIPQEAPGRLTLVLVLVRKPRRKVRRQAVRRQAVRRQRMHRQKVHRPASLPRQQRLANSSNSLIHAV